MNGSIDRDSPSWTTALLDQYIETIQVFSKYDNVLAYNVGNEVVIAPNGTAAAAFLKAAARDVKSYLGVSSDVVPAIPSFIFAAVIPSNRPPSWDMQLLMAIRHGSFPWPNISLVIPRALTLVPPHLIFMGLTISTYHL